MHKLLFIPNNSTKANKKKCAEWEGLHKTETVRSVKLTKLSNIKTWLRSQKLKQNKLAKESPKFILTYRKIVSIFVTFVKNNR